MLNRNGVIKIIDFGLARSSDQSHIKPGLEQMTPNVSTALYKAPEMFFGQKVYCEKIDIWACGLIFFELLTQKELLPTTQGELGVIVSIFNHFGFPKEAQWPGIAQLPVYRQLQEEYRKVTNRSTPSLRALIEEARKNIDPSALDLINHMLTMNPDKRYSA